MVDNLSLSERFTYNTVRIECESREGDISTGTGFYCVMNIGPAGYMPVIVTNKHVIKDALVGHLHLHSADATGAPQVATYTTYRITDFEKGWMLHPDPSIDLCVMPIAAIHRDAESQGHRIFYVPVEPELIPMPDELANLTALEEVVMIGYPNGIWDSVNNMPIIRRGVTATHPRLDYNGAPEFMIDAACFPGSSGSPVYLYNPTSYATREGAKLGTRVKLLGVLYAGPQQTVVGDLEVTTIPARQKVVSVSRIPINLGVVIKSYKLLDFQPMLAAVENNLRSKRGTDRT